MLKFRPLMVAVALACTSQAALAGNEIRIPAPIVKSAAVSEGGQNPPVEDPGNWMATLPEEGEWANVGSVHCSLWAPAVETQVNRVEFTQTGQDCTQVQSRTVQPMEINDKTLEVRVAGAPYPEEQTIQVDAPTQEAKGTLQGDFMDIPRQYRIYVTNNEYWGYLNNYTGRENFSNGARMGSVRYSDYTKNGVKGNYMIILQMYDTPAFASNAEAAAYIQSTFGDVYVPALGVTLESKKAAFKTRLENDLQPYWAITEAQFQAMGGRTTEGSYRIVFTNPQ